MGSVSETVRGIEFALEDGTRIVTQLLADDIGARSFLFSDFRFRTTHMSLRELSVRALRDVGAVAARAGDAAGDGSEAGAGDSVGTCG